MVQAKEEMLEGISGKDDEAVIEALLTIRVKAL